MGNPEIAQLVKILKKENEDPEETFDDRDDWPLIPERERIMVCIDQQRVPMRRWGSWKRIMYWCDPEDETRLAQFFEVHKKYTLKTKALVNFIIATGERPKRHDRVPFEKMIGIKARVSIVVVHRTDGRGGTLPSVCDYSKVDDVLESLGRIDRLELQRLRNKLKIGN